MPANPVASPCIEVCIMNDETGFCEGCKRTRDEIAAWPLLTNEEREKVIKLLATRNQRPQGR